MPQCKSRGYENLATRNNRKIPGHFQRPLPQTLSHAGALEFIAVHCMLPWQKSAQVQYQETNTQTKFRKQTNGTEEFSTGVREKAFLKNENICFSRIESEKK